MQKYQLGDLITLSKGKKPKRMVQKPLLGFSPYVDIQAFETGKIDNYTDGDKCVECNDRDLLIVCDGSRSGLVGKAINGYVGSTLARIDVVDGVDKDYLFYFIQSKYMLLNKNVKGTGTPHLKQDLLKSFELFVPLLDKQKEIVSQIEKQLSQLENAVETLKQTKQQLEIYRQAILEEAFSCKNTDQIIEIYQIADSIRNGQFGTMLHKSDYVIDGVPVINPQHIKNGIIVPNAKNCVSVEKAKELSNYQLQTNDIVMGRRGEMGRTAPVTDKENGWLCGTGSIFFRLKPECDAVLYSKILSSPKVVHYLEKNATGTTMKNLNEEIVSRIHVVCIDKSKQQQITQRIEEQFSICENIEITIDQSLQKAEALQQSILKRAFEGV